MTLVCGKRCPGCRKSELVAAARLGFFFFASRCNPEYHEYTRHNLLILEQGFAHLTSGHVYKVC